LVKYYWNGWILWGQALTRGTCPLDPTSSYPTETPA